MYKEYPTTWSFWHWTEDFQTQIGNYATAKESYLKAIDIMGAPYETDPIDSLAQVCEMDCDIQGAIATMEYGLEVAKKEWAIQSMNPCILFGAKSQDRVVRQIRRIVV